MAHIVKGVRRATLGFLAITSAFIATLALTPGVVAQAATPPPSVSISSPSAAQATTIESSNVLKPGTYYIQSSIGGRHMLDIAGASKRNRANAQIYTVNMTNAQKWRVSVDKDGFYSFQSVASGKYLDLSSGRARNGQNVWQYTGNNTKAQKWTIEQNGNGFTIISAVNKNFALDVAGARAKNSTNVQVYKQNDTAAQRWWFIPTNPAVSSEQTIQDGVYEIKLTKNQDFAIDLAGASSKNGANIQLYKRNNSQAQKWVITRESDGFYAIRNYASGKPLDVSGGHSAVRTNVQSYANNNTNAQRWAIIQNDNGSYTFINKGSGLALDVASAKAANNTNVQTFLETHGASQQFSIAPTSLVSPGVFNLYSQLSPNKQVIDIKDGSQAEDAAAQLYRRNETTAQVFQLRRVSGNIYLIQSALSGKYLEDVAGNVVQKTRNEGSTAQQWEASYVSGGVGFTNVATGMRITAKDGKSANETLLITEKPRNTKAQSFRLKGTHLIGEGYYFVKHKNGNVLDVKNGSLKNSANVQLYSLNKGAAQKFYIAPVGGNYYKLVNNKSDKALDVKGGSKANGANVQQYIFNGTAAQAWKAELGIDGGFTFTNKGSGKALSVANKAASVGANIVQNPRSGDEDQTWYLSPTTSTGISGNAKLDRYIRQIVSQNNGDLAKCFNWTKRNIKFVGSVRGEELPFGIVDKQQTIRFALYGFDNRAGDCYYYASVFMWLARGCGYDAHVRAGKVKIRGGRAAHGWTEIYVEGKPFISDVNLAVDIGAGRNWHMMTYENAPVYYYR